MRVRIIFIQLLFLIAGIHLPLNEARAQKKKIAKENRKQMMRDTLDGKLDFTHFLVDAHGFIPLPYIITEPALGGFGGAIVPLFITPKKVPASSGYVPPDITAGLAMYTVNNSWTFGAGRLGSFPEAGIKYRVSGAYGDINMSFYRDLPGVGEKELPFNMEMIPLSLSISKKVTKQDLYAGVKYLYLRTKLEARFLEDLPDIISSKEMDNHTGTVGFFLDLDKRNTMFTPDRGIRANVEIGLNNDWTGSDFQYGKLSELFNWFFQIKDNWVGGIRFEGNHVFGDAPFYLLPEINLRGIPNARYQGQNTLVLETEHRFDLNLRWSVVGFVGYGKAIEEDESFGEGKDVFAAGTGFRYLIARVFKMRMGIDIAKGTDSWGWYIVFGHNWNR